MGGLQRTWDKIKAYLTNWKTTNFGSGTYSNSGSITVNENSAFEVDKITSYNTMGHPVVVGSKAIANSICLFTAMLTAINQRVYITEASGMAIVIKTSLNPMIVNNTGKSITYVLIAIDNDSDGNAKVRYSYGMLADDASISRMTEDFHLFFWIS